MSPIITARRSRAFCSRCSTPRWAATRTFKQVYSVVVHAGVISALGAAVHRPVELLPRNDGQRDQPRRSCCRCCPRESFVGAAGRHDRPVRRSGGCSCLAIGLGGALSAPHAADRDGAVRGLCRHRAGGRRRHEPFGGNALSRNKKILIGVGDRRVLGAIAYANFKFKRNDGLEVNDRGDPEAAARGHRLRVGQDPAEARSSTSAPTRWAGSPIWPSTRATASTRAVPAADRSAQSADGGAARTEASLAASRRRSSSCACRSTAQSVALKQAEDNYTRQQELWKGGLTTREALERAGERAEGAPGGSAPQEQQLQHAAAAHGVRRARRSRARATT